MKKFLLVAVLLTMVMVIPSMVMASLVINRVDGYFSGNGGEFTLYNGAPSNGSYSGSPTQTRDLIQTGSFQTFCLETDEYVNMGGTYNYNYSGAAVLGGSNSNTSDTLSKGTAWLLFPVRSGNSVWLQLWFWTGNFGRGTSKCDLGS